MASELIESKKYFIENFHSNIGNMILLWKEMESIISEGSLANDINKLKDAKSNSITDS